MRVRFIDAVLVFAAYIVQDGGMKVGNMSYGRGLDQ
jgi:hypothetical protein